MNFYRIRTHDKSHLDKQDMGHDDCMKIAMMMPVTTLTKDVEEWLGKAKHGDIFRITYDDQLIALQI